MEKESHHAEILDLDLGVATDEISVDSLGEWGECAFSCTWNRYIM